ncbi:MAG: hypothetical protein AOA65_2403 [Candidatus Bathyarchaeota archaeon BA1]|nr:MAG: hypothetical protein AOA65_2403 [Candidatus Bathyarchaeota archaeon BA1]
MAKNSRRVRLKVKDIVGRKVLVLGEASSGKTRLIARLLDQLTSLAEPCEITIIDMAPQRIGDIGGKLSDYTSSVNKVRNLSPRKVYAPRLTGTSREQVLEYAELNRKAIEPLLSQFIQKPTKFLIINDITLYLHSGDLEKILHCLTLAQTFLASGYHGRKLAEDRGAGISLRETQLIEMLAKRMDKIIRFEELKGEAPS